MLERPHIRYRKRQPSSASKQARDRRYRHRLRAGKIIAPVEVDAAIVDLLIKLEWLREADAGSSRAIADAIGRMLAASARCEPSSPLR